MNRIVETVEQCKMVIGRLKEQGYCYFGSGGDWYDDGFEIKYIDAESNVIRFKTFKEDVQKYFLQNGTWRNERLTKVRIIADTETLKKGQECILVYDYNNGKYLIYDGLTNACINKSITEIVY